MPHTTFPIPEQREIAFVRTDVVNHCRSDEALDRGAHGAERVIPQERQPRLAPPPTVEADAELRCWY